MKKTYFLILTFLITVFSQAQIVTLNPSNAGADDAATIIFDATQGNAELVGASKVYMHHGIVISSPTGTDWNYVIGNWGEDDGVGEMTLVDGETDKWEIDFSPSIREYFDAPSSENIFRISAVFRSADGNVKGTIAPGEYGWGTVTDNFDIYINLNTTAYVSITSPFNNESYIDAGESINIEATASAAVTEMKIWIDEGAGYTEKAAVSSGTFISYSYSPTESIEIDIKVTATIGDEALEAEKTHQIVVLQSTLIEELPLGLNYGINYSAVSTTATLVLEAPGKDFAFVVGDFTNWEIKDEYQMKQTPDGELFWLEIDNLTPQLEYVFQYWVDGTIKIGDPYADKVADPWNDEYIDESVYPNLPVYDKTEYQTATVLQTGQEPYEWNTTEDTWERPNVDHLVIYELLVRDFVGSHTYADIIDSLQYLKRLGINALELMPVNEFEGNESWGYNPSYYFAPDKYYGPKDELKRLIEAAHEMGMAVIIDMVLNHAYGQNAMVKLYFDQTTGKPSEDNPWFNAEYVGPFQWGYDFNHESDYTKAFIDKVNAYWLEEYHFDGFRFDFTKGFTNYAPNGNIDGYDQSRINILKRMADQIWTVDPDAYIILEHWGSPSEELELSNYGMKLWKNRSYDYVPITTGNNSGNFNNMDATTHVSYFNSHDERRIADHVLAEGQVNDGYDIRNPFIMYERVKMAAAFTYLFPGPKMIWQFDELGYDINIDFNGRVGNKPLPWGPDGLGYYEDELRQYIYDTYQGILDVRNQIGPEKMAAATKNHLLYGFVRRLSFDTDDIDLVLIGNFGLEELDINPAFSQTGTWYNYFSGEEINVTDIDAEITLKAGEWTIYTTEKLSDGIPDAVEVFVSPVTVSPYPFTKNTAITITLDATLVCTNGTNGLTGASKVYMHSGIVTDHPDSTTLSNVVGTLTDDGVGQMTEVSDDIWEITIIPNDYYSIGTSQDVYKIGMYFRDANNTNFGMGFRDQLIYFKVQSDGQFVTIEPAAFTINDQITVTFDALQGNQELVGAGKVYMHSSVDLTNTATPHNTAWQHVVGNWGEDDGVGEMTEVEENKWQITFVPKNYYGLADGDIAYWLAAVFRSADGSIKGTGTPGELENGYIHTNFDFFIRNQLGSSVTSLNTGNELILYPNPAYTNVYIEINNSERTKANVFIYDNIGQKLGHIFSGELPAGKLDIEFNTFDYSLLNGIYYIVIQTEKSTITKKLIINN